MKQMPLMKCGCIATATREGGTPVCITHFDTPEGNQVHKTPPDLEGRTARCAYCKKEAPSSYSLPFFELARGPKTWRPEDKQEVDKAKRDLDRYRETNRPKGKDPEDERLRLIYVAAREKAENNKSIEGAADIYYCGCRGWD